MQTAIKVNKQGQALGRKGGETRRRLLDATLELIATEDSHKLTASRIARAAGLASQSFYLYFRDIDEILLVLAEEASADFATVKDVIEAAPAKIPPAQLSRRLVDALAACWDRNRAILSLRNYLADCGSAEFLKLRYRTSMPLINSLAQRVQQAQPELDVGAARGRAIIIFQAMERTVARENAAQYPEAREPADMRAAAADVLTLLLTPPAA